MAKFAHVTAQKTQNKLASFLIGACLVVLLGLPGVKALFQIPYYTSHDGEGHVIRMAEFYQAFLDGELPVRWSKRLYFGYGYPFFNFNYPAVYYFGIPFMAVGLTAAEVMKTETIVMYLLSGVLMFGYLRRKVSDPYALVGATLYLYAPYRFINIYVRGSVAESVAFIFPPLLLWLAELIAIGKPKIVLWGSLIIFYLAISHNISALLLLSFFFSYVIFLSISQKSWRIIKDSLVCVSLGLVMAGFFLIPALTEKKYTFLDQTIAKDYPAHFIALPQLLNNQWGFGSSVAGTDDGLSFSIGWVHLSILIVGWLLLILGKKPPLLKMLQQQQLFTLLFFSLIVLIAAIFFMLPLSKSIWDHLPLLPFVQFPWRFLFLTVPTLTILDTIILYSLANTYQWSATKVFLSLLILISATLFFAKDQWHIDKILIPQTVSGDALVGTTSWADEQATHWLTPKPTAIPDQKVVLLPITDTGGTIGTIEITEWQTIKHVYTITNSTPTLVVENTMYYPGWQVTLDGMNLAINYQHSEFPGRIVYELQPGTHIITSYFGETKMRLLADILSVATFFGLLTKLVWPTKKTHTLNIKY